MSVEGVSKRFASRDGVVTALEDIGLELCRGELVAVLGVNGAGKTTLVKIIAGLVLPDAGVVRIGELRSSEGEYRRRVAAVLEGNRNIYWRLTVRENLVFFARIKGRPRAEAIAAAEVLLGELGLGDKRKEEARRLSRGMQQRLAVGCAVIQRPEVLLLDEPTLGVDFQSERKLKELLQALCAEGLAILLTSHDYRLIEEVASRVLVVNRGRMVHTGSAETLRATLGLEPTYEVRVQSEASERLVRTAHDSVDEMLRLVARSKRSAARVVAVNRIAPSLEDAMSHLLDSPS
jgi:ABC-2 type transport system ATP-binding protein